MTTETETQDFTVDREEKPLTIDGDAHVLIELDGRQRDKYLTRINKRVRIGPDGKQNGMKTFDGLQASLIAACLVKIEGDKRVPVPLEIIQNWPARTIDGVYKLAQKLSALGDEGKKKTKDGDEDGEDGDEGND